MNNINENKLYLIKLEAYVCNYPVIKYDIITIQRDFMYKFDMPLTTSTYTNIKQ